MMNCFQMLLSVSTCAALARAAATAAAQRAELEVRIINEEDEEEDSYEEAEEAEAGEEGEEDEEEDGGGLVGSCGSQLWLWEPRGLRRQPFFLSFELHPHALPSCVKSPRLNDTSAAQAAA